MTDYECSDRGGDAAAYVLGALEPHEESAFTSHLGSCLICRDELEEFGQVIGVLALAPPQYKASRRLKRAVMRDVRASAVTAPQVAEGRRQPARRRPAFRMPGLNLAGGLATGLVAIALVATGLESLGGSSAAPVRTINARVQGVAGSAQVRVSSGHAELIVNHFSAPATGEIYEVWKQPARGKPQATGTLFSVTSTGHGVVDVPGSVKSTADILVTQEPAGGSPEPTSNPVIVAALA